MSDAVVSPSLYPQLGRIPASHRAAARAVLERRSDSVLRHLLLGTVSGPFLTDFDWAVKVSTCAPSSRVGSVAAKNARKNYSSCGLGFSACASSQKKLESSSKRISLGNLYLCSTKN